MGDAHLGRTFRSFEDVPSSEIMKKKKKTVSIDSHFLKMPLSFRAFYEITDKVALVNLYREENSEKEKTGNT